MTPHTPLRADLQALLDVYRKALNELITLITPLSDAQLCAIADPHTPDPDCVSIQSILRHIVQSGYGYTVFVEHAVGQHDAQRPEPQTVQSAKQYVSKLNSMFIYCEQCFQKNAPAIAQHLDEGNRINTPWGQIFDIDQMMSHAIVHVLRHHRQIVRFIALG